MRTPRTAPPAWVWARHLVEGDASTASSLEALPPAEAERVRRYRDALLHAWQTRDAAALRQAKQEVLHAAWHGGSASAAGRRTLRELAWRMTGLLSTRCTKAEGY